MSRQDPEYQTNSPILVRAFWNALQRAVGVVVPPQERQAHYGKRWLITDLRTIPSADAPFYIYIENPTDLPLDIEGSQLYTNQRVTLTVYDEPDLDETTFTAGEFRNTRSSVTKDPEWNLYKGLSTDVTINDSGRVFLQDEIDTGPQSSVGEHFDAPGYVVDPDSSALIEIDLNGTDTRFSINTYCHEQVNAPDLTTLDGTN